MNELPETSSGQDTDPKREHDISPVRIILILLIIAAVTESVTLLLNYVTRYGTESFPEYTGYDVEQYHPEVDASDRGGMGYLTDDEVKLAGEACTELGHFSFDGESLIGAVSEIFDEEGIGVDNVESTSYNQIYGDGGSWYETLITFSLIVPGQDNDYQSLTLNCDTATGALHEIDLFISDRDRLLSLTQKIMQMLNIRTQTFDDAALQEAFDSLARSTERGENMYATYGTPGTPDYIAVTLYCFEDGFSVYIGRE